MDSGVARLRGLTKLRLLATVRLTGLMKYRAVSDQSGLMPANLITLAHLSIS